MMSELAKLEDECQWAGFLVDGVKKELDPYDKEIN